MHKGLIFGLIGLISVGCTTRLVDFTTISTKNVDWSRAATFSRAPVRVEGKDVVHIIVFIPTGIPNMKEAIDQAIESKPGCVALVDGVVYQKLWWIPYIYGQSSFVVEGTPLIDSGLSGNIMAKPIVAPVVVEQKPQSVPVVAAQKPDTSAQLQKLKELKDAGLLTEQEYETKRKELVGQL
ncbi:MAG: SHOCT domain-containing protein [Kiritimatiellaceae bacterium]|nr:SHOCT domain-containing protein [Kiritimatiellaceae bacterium]